MTCNCDNDGSNEYIIELNQQGAPGVKGDKGDSGYSPIVTYTTDGNGVQINIVNETTTEQTPVLPTKSYADTQLASKLNKDGSNADNPISINGLKIKQQQQDLPVYLSSNTNGGVCITNNTNTYLTLATNELSYRNAVNDVIFELFGQYTAGTNQLASNKDFYFNNWNNSKFYYGYYGNYNEIATVDQIPTVGNGTITLTQNGVTKGTFTTNQSGNTTINLDSGVTNPLSIKLEGDNVTYSLNMGINTSTHKAEMSYGLATSGSYIGMPIKLIGSTSNPLELTDLGMGVNTLSLNINSNTLEVNQDNELTVKVMTGCDSITGGASGLVPAPSAGDEDKFLKADGTWDTVGGGGSSYTEGTGIDITNDTISIDTSVVAQLSDIPDTSDMATQTWVGNQGYLTSITSGDVTTALGYTPLQSSDLSDYVTTNTAQTISGSKTFSSETHHAGVITFDSALLNPIVRGMSGSSYRNMIYRMGNDSAIIVGNSNDTIDLKGSGTRPTYNNNTLALYSDIPTNSDYVDLSSNQTVGGNKTFTGTNYLRNTYICNAGGTYFGRMRAVDNKFTFEGIGTNRSINFIPDGTGELQYNGNEVQTTNKLVTSVDSSSTDSQYPSAKLFYDTVGDIETLINAL